MLNLFLALLLSSFGAESLQQEEDDGGKPNKLQEAVDRINRFVLFVKSHVMYCIKMKVIKKGTMNEFGSTTIRTDYNSKDMVDGAVLMRNGRVRRGESSTSPDCDETSRNQKKSKWVQARYWCVQFLSLPLDYCIRCAPQAIPLYNGCVDVTACGLPAYRGRSWNFQASPRRLQS